MTLEIESTAALHRRFFCYFFTSVAVNIRKRVSMIMNRRSLEILDEQDRRREEYHDENVVVV